MSHTTTYLKATCHIAPGKTSEELAKNIADYLGNHEEELNALPGLYDYEQTADEVAEQISKYLAIDNFGNLTISCDTSQTFAQGSDTEVAEFLCNHLCYLQDSEFMMVTWVTIDSREGMSMNHYWLSPGGDVSQEHSC